MGETRVDLVHLLEDLRDAYPGSLEETILTEIVANALDSGATSLRISLDATAATLTAIDDGHGMTRRELARYHDLGSSTKRKGKGIGFAGVGIKLGLLLSHEVVTETRRERVHAATAWRLASRSRAPWSFIDPPHFLDAHGTAVSLQLANPLSQLLDRGFVETTVLRHFQPLFEPEFVEILEPVYPAGLRILIDDAMVVGPIRSSDRVPIAVRIGRQRRPTAVGYLARHPEKLSEGERGVAISTLGKVILRGWDWLGITPADAERIEGLIEVPTLAESLTLNKGDFRRTGAAGATFLAYRKAIQEAVSEQLAAWGSTPEPPARTPRIRPIERDLHRVLEEMADEYPLLATLAERRSGGQRRLALGTPQPGDGGRGAAELPLHVDLGESEPPLAARGSPSPRQGGDSTASAPEEPRPPSTTEPSRASGAGAGDAAGAPITPADTPSRRRTRAAHLALQIRFEILAGDDRLARLIESTVWVNEAHPAYTRAVASRSEGYHLAVAVASALAPLTVEPARTHEFLNAFLARWGEAGAAGARARARRSAPHPSRT